MAEPVATSGDAGAWRGLAVHALVYLAVNLLLVCLWALFDPAGSLAEVPSLLTDLPAARAAGFYPAYVILLWGLGLAVHAVVVIAGAPGRRRRDRAAATTGSGAAIAGAAGGGAPPTDLDRPPPGAAPSTRPWLAVLFTDIVGSTPLNAELGDEAWADHVAEHRRLVRSVTADHDGVEVGTQGDGFLLRFDRPDDAAACAVALQRRLAAARDTDGTVPLHVRMGIHAGEVVDRDDDLVGQVVNLAARVTAAARPDEILVTEPMADHLGVAVELEDRGLVSLKGIERPRHLLALSWGRGVTAR